MDVFERVLLKPTAPKHSMLGRTLYTLIPGRIWNSHAHIRAGTGTLKKKVKIEKSNFENSKKYLLQQFFALSPPFPPLPSCGTGKPAAILLKCYKHIHLQHAAAARCAHTSTFCQLPDFKCARNFTPPPVAAAPAVGSLRLPPYAASEQQRPGP